jgi:hypothetical protein
VREPAGKDDGVGSGKRVVAVPCVIGVRAFAAQRVQDVLLAVRAGKDDDCDGRLAQIGSKETE